LGWNPAVSPVIRNTFQVPPKEKPPAKDADSLPALWYSPRPLIGRVFFDKKGFALKTRAKIIRIRIS
jgi:hypothetical protein